MRALDCERRHVALCLFVVISRVSYLLWVNYHQPHENTLIKKKKKLGEVAHLPLVWSADKFIWQFCP